MVDRNAKILDVGAGTGLSADKLKPFGYVNIDSLEPAENMVEIAKKKGCYVNYFVEGLTDNKRSSIQDSNFLSALNDVMNKKLYYPYLLTTSLNLDAYDALISQGAFGLEGHIPSSGLRECIRLIKPNGLVFIIFRYEYLFLNKEYAQNFDRVIEEMQNEGIAEVLVKTRFPEYLKTKEGIILILKKIK